MSVGEVRTSPWVRPGWHVAICQDCPDGLVAHDQDPAVRDREAALHVEVTGHNVGRFDGEQR